MRMLITGGLVARADGVFNTDILIEATGFWNSANGCTRPSSLKERKSWTCPAAWSCPAESTPIPTST
ncbi:MAG: hypothetical protein ACLT2T_01125 [Bilophila wadsworthia]